MEASNGMLQAASRVGCETCAVLLADMLESSVDAARDSGIFCVLVGVFILLFISVLSRKLAVTC
jgi:hypothetical protein